MGKDMLVSIDLSSNSNPITIIGARAFKNCTNLSVITLPADLTTIEEKAFSGSGLEEITIPEHVTTIGAKAFADCADLTSVIISSSDTELSDDVVNKNERQINYCIGSVWDGQKHDHLVADEGASGVEPGVLDLLYVKGPERN